MLRANGASLLQQSSPGSRKLSEKTPKQQLLQSHNFGIALGLYLLAVLQVSRGKGVRHAAVKVGGKDVSASLRLGCDDADVLDRRVPWHMPALGLGGKAFRTVNEDVHDLVPCDHACAVPDLTHLASTRVN